jgi:predicted Zn finger-like uncharacterized protein
MIVTCPACSTRYLLDPRALGSAGRVVRCAGCAKTWHQEPPEDLPRSLELAPDPDPDTGRKRPRGGRYPPPALPPRRRPWATIALVVVLALLLSGAVAGVFARDEVVQLWPPAAKLYSMVGLPALPPGSGLEFRKPNSRRDKENGVPVLIIEGEIANTTNLARDVPKLKVELRDRDGNELQNWIFAASESRVLPGASVPFHTTILQPSDAATGVVVTFAEGG